MSLAALHKTVTYFYAFLGLAALGLGDQLGPTALGLLFSGLVITWFIEGPLLHRPEYARLWSRVTLVVFSAQTIRGALFDAPMLPLGVELIGFLQLSRLASRRSAVEHQQIAAIGFLHLIAATLLSTDVEYGLLFLGFIVVTPWMLALTHFRREIERVASVGARDDAEAAARALPMLESRGIVGPRFLLGIASLALPLFFLTAAVFLVFPRVG
ncbi:MAG: hypothetical protein H5U40_01390, partial [Polyangiaceae bacterium]|nr:hypothetical protein [Polyangiaceae bacterium]